MLIDGMTLLLICVSMGMAFNSFLMHHRQHIVDEILDAHHEEAIDFSYLEAFIRELQNLIQQL